jgi:hypothetical protein
MELRIFVIVLLSLFMPFYFWLILSEIKIKNSEKESKQFSLEKYMQERNIRNIIALVFYGREKSVSILMKYLEKNVMEGY